MMRKILLIPAAASVLCVFALSASAQVSEMKGSELINTNPAPASPTKRTGKPPAASGQAGTPGLSFLIADECKKLGGAVHIAPQCKKTGTRCVVRLPGGQINAPCIDEVALSELDFIDVGEVVPEEGFVPVVIKSLAFGV